MGIEYNPDRVALAKSNAVKAGVANKTSFVKADLFATDFSKRLDPQPGMKVVVAGRGGRATWPAPMARLVAAVSPSETGLTRTHAA